MIFFQGGLSFLIWIGYGFLQSRNSRKIREQVGRMSRAQRGILGAALYLVGAMVLIGGLGIVLERGGFTNSGLTPIAWIVVVLLGLAFVHAQTMATAMLVSLIQLNVTNGPNAASINRTPGDQTQS